MRSAFASWLPKLILIACAVGTGYADRAGWLTAIPQKQRDIVNAHGIMVLAIALTLMLCIPWHRFPYFHKWQKMRGFIRATKKSMDEYSKLERVSSTHIEIVGPFSQGIKLESERLFVEHAKYSNGLAANSKPDPTEHIKTLKALSVIFKMEIWRDRLFRDIAQFELFVIHTLHKDEILKHFPIIHWPNNKEYAALCRWDDIISELETHIEKLELEIEGLESSN